MVEPFYISLQACMLRFKSMEYVTTLGPPLNLCSVTGFVCASKTSSSTLAEEACRDTLYAMDTMERVVFQVNGHGTFFERGEPEHE
jgi:hypothetical protein